MDSSIVYTVEIAGGHDYTAEISAPDGSVQVVEIGDPSTSTTVEIGVAGPRGVAGPQGDPGIAGMLLLENGAEVPGGTPAGTVIFEKDL